MGLNRFDLRCERSIPEHARQSRLRLALSEHLAEERSSCGIDSNCRPPKSLIKASLPSRPASPRTMPPVCTHLHEAYAGWGWDGMERGGKGG